METEVIEMETKPRTWKPTVAGILTIIDGSLNLLGVLGVIIAAIFLSASSYLADLIGPDIYPLTLGVVIGILVTVAVFMAIVGILSLLGGISALQRKRWGLALAGSICAVFGSISILGILAIIFTAMSKNEFVS